MRSARLVRRLMGWLAPADLRQSLFDDLDEAFAGEVTRRGLARARMWYWRQAIAGVAPLLTIRLRRALAGATRRPQVGVIDRAASDVRYSLRLLARSPGFTLAAVLTLALGIGANTAIFTVAWQLILKPLPYPTPQQLVQVWEWTLSGSINSVAPGNFHDWQTESRSFQALAAYTYFRGAHDLTGSGEPEQLEVRHVTADYFRVFDMAALAGRPLDVRDTTDEARTVVISESLWRRRFGGEVNAIGRRIRLGDTPRTIVGVMPADFQTAAGRVDIWAGMSVRQDPASRRLAHYLAVVGRLKPGVTVAQADDDVKRIAAEAARLYPESNARLSATVRSLQGHRESALREGLVVLSGAAGFVLLIACANVASLQFARGMARGREFAVRAALGATRARLVRQLLTESLVLALVGTAAGLALGLGLLRILARVAPAAVGRAIDAGPDLVVAGVGVGLAAFSALLSATAPAWRAASGATRHLQLRQPSGDRAAARIRTLLVTAEIGLAIVLVISASLLVTSLVKVLRVDPGFDPAGVLAFDVSLPETRYPTFDHRDRFFQETFDELRAIPGVTAACAINEIPFDDGGTMSYVPEGQPKAVNALPRTVTRDCFDLLRIALVQGRMFAANEPTRVGVVTANFARAAWPGQNPIGRRVHLGTKDGDLIEIVGVVENSLQRALDDRPSAQFYEVMSPVSAFWPSRVLVRAALAPDAIVPAVRAAVRRVDPQQPVARLRTLEAVVDATVSSRRFDLLVLASFALMAVALAAVGIYGLLVQVVTQRTSEIGLRLALGATGPSVVRLMMRRAWLSVAAGSALGLAGAALASGLLRRFVFGISPTDPRLYVAVAAVLAAVALIAAWLPARRAARVNPIITLRIN